MGLLNKKNIKNANFGNKYNITKNDLIGNLKGLPMGVVIRMLEEQEKQGNKSDVTIFQDNIFAERRLSDGSRGGFDWMTSEAGFDFWSEVIENDNFDLFYKRYPKYKKYDE